MDQPELLKIAVLGAGGQLGQTFRQISKLYPDIAFDFFDKSELNILHKEDIHNVLNSNTYRYVVNCAAYTHVDKAESEPDLCFAINATACKHIAEIMQGTEMRLIHFSSDYIYHSYNGFPLKESTNPEPQGVYASSKLLGEQYIRAASVPALILRASWIVSPFGHNFVKTMLRLGKEKDQLHVVNDQYGAPTYARDLAMAVMSIIRKTEANPTNLTSFNATYNYANEGIVSWFDISTRIMKELQFSCIVHPISSSGYSTPAQRPKWSVLSKQSIKNNFNLEIPHWYRSLTQCLQELTEKQ